MLHATAAGAVANVVEDDAGRITVAVQCFKLGVHDTPAKASARMVGHTAQSPI